MSRCLKSRNVFLLLLLSLTLVVPLSAQSRSLPLGASDLDLATDKAFGELLDDYKNRFDAVNRADGGSPDELELLSVELVAEMKRFFSSASFKAPTKNSTDCDLACLNAKSGRKNADQTLTHANAAVNSSDPNCNTSFTTDAQSQAALAYFFANWGTGYACQGPKGSAQAASLLGSAKTRALNAKAEAWDSYLAGCTESYNTALYATYAADDLHDAVTYALGCN